MPEDFDPGPGTFRTRATDEARHLSDYAARRIRYRHSRGERMSDLAREHGVSYGVVEGICSGETYRSAGGPGVKRGEIDRREHLAKLRAREIHEGLDRARDERLAREVIRELRAARELRAEKARRALAEACRRAAERRERFRQSDEALEREAALAAAARLAERSRRPEER